MRAVPLREAAPSSAHYQRRRPEQTPLYRLVRDAIIWTRITGDSVARTKAA